MPRALRADGPGLTAGWVAANAATSISSDRSDAIGSPETPHASEVVATYTVFADVPPVRRLANRTS